MRLIGRTATALLTTTIVLGGTATAATAQSTTIKDKASDVVSYTDHQDERGTQLGYADSVASGVDMRSLRVKHTKKSVTVRVKFANLSPEATPIISVRRDGESRPTRFVVVADENRASVITTRGSKKCSAPLTARLGKGGYLDVVVKRSCLGDPKRIKVSALAGTGEGFLGDAGPGTVDIFSPTSVRGEGWTKWLKAS
jgi:hypothetical protein